MHGPMNVKEKLLKFLSVSEIKTDHYICKSVFKLLSERGIAKRCFSHFKYCLIYYSNACIIIDHIKKDSCTSFRFLHEQEFGRKKTTEFSVGRGKSNC